MQIQEAHDKAVWLMQHYGLASSGWSFEWDNAKRRFGCCNHWRRVISLSKPMTQLNNEEHVTDTVLHEIAHALVGPSHGHDKEWKAKAKEIGARPVRCYDNKAVVLVKKAFIGCCPNCSKEVQRHRRKKVACKKCCDTLNGGKFSEAYMFKWKRNR